MSHLTPVKANAEPKTLSFVVKISRYCNLRCTYCYEFAHLDDKRRISLDELRVFFRSTAAHAVANGIEKVTFTWHGGEPFMVPLEVYEAIGALQREVMPGLEIVNSAQTNMTILTDRHVAFLKERRFFDRISISFDVGGDKRVDKKGRPTTDIVLANMQRLLDADMEFGTICVLARNNVHLAVNLYRFFHDIDRGCRFLPFYRSTDGTGDDGESLSQAEIVGAYAAIFDEWMQAENAVSIRPLADMMEVAVRYLLDRPRRVYDKDSDEWIYVVSPSGDLHGISEIEDYRYRYGNVFREPLSDILGNTTRQETFAAASARIARVCTGCPYLGHCSGYFVADATDGVVALMEREGCHIRGTIDHIVARLRETGIGDELRERAANAPDLGLGQGAAPAIA